MVSIEERATRRDGVTFVRVVLANESSERKRVRLAVTCDGAVWPPRRRGVPEAGWDEDGVAVTVAADGVRGLGFATPTAPAAVDVTVASTTARGRTATASASANDESESLDGVVRALGAFAPPLAATPREEPGGSDEQSQHCAERPGRPE